MTYSTRLTGESTNGGTGVEERLAIAGGGAIACGLAATAARHGEVVLWARSDRSADRAKAHVEKLCEKELADAANKIQVVRDLDALADASFVVEAVVEDQQSKAVLLQELARNANGDAVLST